MNEIIQATQQFITHPPSELSLFENQLTALHAAIRRPGFSENPPITSQEMNQLVATGEVTSLQVFDTLQELMLGINFNGNQVFEGTGTFFAIDAETGQMYFREEEGHIHRKTTEKDGLDVLDYPGGLADYAVNKAVSVAALSNLGVHPDMGEENDNEYLRAVTGQRTIHMGGFSYKTVDGQQLHVGVSGAEMTPVVVDDINRILPAHSQDGEYTIAGLIDTLVASWTAKLIAGEELTQDQVQQEFSSMLDFVIVETKALRSLPSYFH